MIRLLGSRGASAVIGLLMLALASSGATARTVSQGVSAFNVAAAVKVTEANPTAYPASARRYATDTSARPARALMTAAMVPMQQAVATVTGTAVQAQPAQAITLALAPSIAREAAWLFNGGWPLYALVDRYSTGAPLDAEATCLATAVYFEARGESAEGQLAVARVVMNRAASGKYPPSWCGTVKQPAQFSFVRSGHFPAVNAGCDAWHKAQAIARLAISNAVPSLASDVLWYHANYVAPSWGRRLTRADKIGAHIFYRT